MEYISKNPTCDTPSSEEIMEMKRKLDEAPCLSTIVYFEGSFYENGNKLKEEDL